MKRILMTAAALAALGVAAPAFASQSEVSSTITVNATNPAKCDISSLSNTVTLDADALSDAQGFALTNIGDSVAQKLTALNLTAWCTGGNNSVNLYRTPLAANGGGQTAGGFNQAVIYDVAVSIAGSSRLDTGAAQPIEGTSDGQGFGPGAAYGHPEANVSAFGPTGAGAVVSFSNEASSTSNATTVGTGTGPRTNFTADSARLVAGSYTGTVTLSISPGI